MSTITNDRELRAALDRLSLEQQRAIGIRFASGVKIASSEASDLARLLQGAARSPEGGQQRESAYRSARSLVTKTYTACGSDADWQTQAAHFVAAACAAALAPEEQIAPGSNPAWKAAIQARMAKNCLMMESETGEIENEAQNQYRIAEAFDGG